MISLARLSLKRASPVSLPNGSIEELGFVQDSRDVAATRLKMVAGAAEVNARLVAVKCLSQHGGRTDYP